MLEREVDGLGERLRVAIAEDRILGETLLDGSREARRHDGDRTGNGRGGARQVCVDDGSGCRPIEGEVARECEEAADAERVEVAAPVDRLADGLLGADEMRVAHHASVVGDGSGLHRPGDAEVHHDGAIGAALEENVVGGDVTVHNAGAMGVPECPRHLAHHPRRLTGLERAARAHSLRERDALDVRHDDVDEPAALTSGVDRYDVRMVELRDGLGLPKKLGTQVGPVGQRG